MSAHWQPVRSHAVCSQQSHAARVAHAVHVAQQDAPALPVMAVTLCGSSIGAGMGSWVLCTGRFTAAILQAVASPLHVVLHLRSCMHTKPQNMYPQTQPCHAAVASPSPV
jgi:hypothetical protein